MRNKNIITIALVTVCLLLIPLVAMQLSSEWNWDVTDFIFAGVLIFGTGLAYELVASKSAILAYRAGVGLALAAGFLLVWVNAAAGVIGDNFMPANMMYLAALAVGVLGSFIVRFRPSGMVRALGTTAVLVALVPVIVLVFWPYQITGTPPGLVGVFVLNTLFVLMFVGSALLFRRA